MKTLPKIVVVKIDPDETTLDRIIDDAENIPLRDEERGAAMDLERPDRFEPD
jgi:hypothetical protein